MAKGSYDINRIYLMGCLTDKDGYPTSRHFPLAFETFQLPNNKITQSIKVNKKGESTVQVMAENPIAYSDKNGLLHNFNSDDYLGIEQASLTLTRVPVMEEINKSNKKATQKLLFFPSYLVPLAQETHKTEWLKKLNGYLSASSENDDHLFNVEVNTLNVAEMLALPSNKEECTTLIKNNQYFRHYKYWQTVNKNKSINIIAIPQLYSVVIVFSSSKFEGATVTLADAPAELGLQGDQNSRSSTVKKVAYNNPTKEDKNKKEQYMATFWVTSEKVLFSQGLDQYCRIDVDLTTIPDANMLQDFKDKGLITYSLTERLFHLPIKTPLGRCTLVNGDPISVEETLLNYAPEYYSNLVSQLNAQAHDLPQQLAKNTNKGEAPLPEQVWHHLQTNKGVLEASSGMLEGGVSWGAISKAFSAAVSRLAEVTDYDKGVAGQDVLAIVGVSGASLTVIETLSKIRESQNLSGGISAAIPLYITTWNNILSAPLTNTTVPPFLSGAGKIGSMVLGTPLSAIEMLYNGKKALDAIDKSDAASEEFSDQAIYYANATSSASTSQLVEQKKVGGEIIEKEQQAIAKLKETLKGIVVEREAPNHQTVISEQTAGDVLLRMDATFFAFDRAVINQTNDTVINTYKTIAKELSKLSSPIEVTIHGYTCDIGDPKYNSELSLQRANAVKEQLLHALGSDELRAIWKPKLSTIGHGESDNLVKNTDKESRKKNRRVEILLNFSAVFDYPPCRSELMTLGKAAKISLVTDVKMDEELANFFKSVIDLALVGATALFPPMMFVVAAKQIVELISQGADVLTQITNKDEKNIQEILLKLRHQDIVIITQFLEEAPFNSIHAVILKAYLKKIMAINGLLRLIQGHRYLELESKTVGRNAGSQHTEIIRNKKNSTFEELDIIGYINAFILNDDWDFEYKFTGVMYLDEVWRNRKNITEASCFSFNTIIAQGRALINNMFSDDMTDAKINQAQRYQKYFPIHYMASNSEQYFKSLFMDTPISNLTKEVFSNVVISVRKPYISESDNKKPKKDDWVLFNEFYKENKHQLTPYDNVRILVLLDKSKLGDNIKPLPISLSTMASSVSEYWQFFDKIASNSVEYAAKINENELTDSERKSLRGKVNTEELYGAIITPSYFFGIHQIIGLRPVTDYNSSIMKSLFSEKNKSIGGKKWLNYYFELMIPGNKKSKKELEVIDRSVNGKIYYASRFNLTLSPSREYSFTKDFIKYSPFQKGDRLFYEEGFLSAESSSEMTFPKVFDNAKIDFYLGQQNLMEPRKQRSENEDDTNDPLIASEERLRGKIDTFNWEEKTKASLVIRSNSQDKSALKAAGYDANIIPLSNVTANYTLGGSLSESSMPISDFQCVYRLGEIKKEKDKYIFYPIKDKGLPRDVYRLIRRIMRFSSNELGMLALDDGYFGAKQEVTDIFANVIELSYLNIFGVKVKGLRPLLPPSRLKRAVSINVTVNGPKNSGIDGVESNEIMILSLINEYIKNWYFAKESLIEIAESQVEINSNMALGNNSGLTKKHNITKLMTWLDKEEDEFIDFKRLTEKRKDMLDDWIDSSR